MIDFDKQFEAFLRERIEKNEDISEESIKEFENQLPTFYEQFINTPNNSIDGLTPKAYMQKFTSANELINEFIISNEDDSSPCALLLDRITEVRECASELFKIIETSSNTKMVMCAINLLQEMNEPHPVVLYAKWLIDGNKDRDLIDIIADVLMEHANEVKEILLSSINKVELWQKEIIADILVCAGKDDRTFELLNELFITSRNLPFTAGLFGKYGDERAVAVLYPKLDECVDAYDFIEVRNAIEQLGGVVDETAYPIMDKFLDENN